MPRTSYEQRASFELINVSKALVYFKDSLQSNLEYYKNNKAIVALIKTIQDEHSSVDSSFTSSFRTKIKLKLLSSYSSEKLANNIFDKVAKDRYKYNTLRQDLSQLHSLIEKDPSCKVEQNLCLLYMCSLAIKFIDFTMNKVDNNAKDEFINFGKIHLTKRSILGHISSYLDKCTLTPPPFVVNTSSQLGTPYTAQAIMQPLDLNLPNLPSPNEHIIQLPENQELHNHLEHTPQVDSTDLLNDQSTIVDNSTSSPPYSCQPLAAMRNSKIPATPSFIGIQQPLEPRQAESSSKQPGGPPYPPYDDLGDQQANTAFASRP